MTEQPQDAVPETPVTQTSDFQQELIAAGAKPVQIDYEALLAHQKWLEGRLAALEAERGVPSDPIAGGKANLIAHIEARAAQYPYVDFSEILNAAKDLPEKITRDHTELVKTLVADFANGLKHLEVGYLPELASNLHKEVLKKAVSAS